MAKTEKVLNIKTGKMENCTVGAGCQRHAHAPLTINSTQMEEALASFNDFYVPEIDKEYHSGNDFGGILKVYDVKVTKTGASESLVAITSKLGGEAVGLDRGESTFVEVKKEEARFMDRDKMTAALEYAIFKDSYKANSPIYINYTLYGTSGESNIYKVDRFLD
jgi:hypothetical protein